MQPAGGDDNRKWNIEPWGDGSYMFVDVKNGSGYRVDCHLGNPLFTSSETTGCLSPRSIGCFRAWLLSMMGAFLTTITGAVRRKPAVKLGIFGGILGADGLVGEPEDFNICYDINSFPAFFEHNWDGIGYDSRLALHR